MAVSGDDGGDDFESSSGDSGDADAPGSDQLRVTQSRTAGGVTVTIRGATAGDSATPSFDLAGPSSQAPAVTLSSMNVTFAADQSTVEVTVFEPTTDSGPLPLVPRGDALGYARVETGLDDEAVGSVAVAIQLDAQALPDNRSRDSVVVYRYTNGSWTALPTRYDSSAGQYLASADGLSSLAVASLEPGQVRVVNATSPPDWASQGYRANVTATVENPGDRPAQRNLTVTVDGRPVANQTVRLEPGERDEVTIGFPAGSGTVAVEGTEAGRMNVSEGDQWDRDPNPGLSASGPGFDLGLVALLFVALVLVGAVQRLRRLRR